MDQSNTRRASLPPTGMIAAFLADSNARCPACTYALRGCTSDKCPECGCALTLAIASLRTMSGWWLAGVLGLSLSVASVFLTLLGLGVFIINHLQRPGLQVQVRSGMASSSELPRWPMIVALTVLLLLLTLALARLGSRRHAFLRMPNPQRAVLGLLAAASPLLTLAAIAIIGSR